MMYRKKYKKGDPVIFAKDKRSTCPGPRAHGVHPAKRGEGYFYKVDKFWMTEQDEQDGKVTLITRRGRVHVVDVDDPRLHHASVWQRLRYRKRFPRHDLMSKGTSTNTRNIYHA